MKKNSIIVITREHFVLKNGEIHEITLSDGKHTIECIDKKSKFGTGNQTVYTCICDGVTYTDKPIGFYKNLFGAIVYHRDGTAINAKKVLSSDELEKVVTNFESKVLGLIDSLNNLIGKVSETAEKVSYNVPELVSVFRANLIENNEKAKAENEKAKAAKAEKAEKAERREIAKDVLNMDGLQAELVKAVLANDFAKIAELTTKMQSA